MNLSTRIKVLNRDSGAVVYSIPQMNGLRRVFQSGETKEITFEQLQKLSYIPGGEEILQDSLVILDNKEAIQNLLGKPEPEYFYTKEDIKKLMLTGSLDEFLDCLDFAPEGVCELIKGLAVELPLNDVAKRKAIFEKLGFNVDKAIEIEQDSAEPSPESHETSHRRVQKTQTNKTITGRRVITQKN